MTGYATREGNLRQYDTFAKAEAVARRSYRTRPERGDGVWFLAEDGRTWTHLAYIADDALGRLWTCLTWEGGKHV